MVADAPSFPFFPFISSKNTSMERFISESPFLSDGPKMRSIHSVPRFLIWSKKLDAPPATLSTKDTLVWLSLSSAIPTAFLIEEVISVKVFFILATTPFSSCNIKSFAWLPMSFNEFRVELNNPP